MSQAAVKSGRNRSINATVVSILGSMGLVSSLCVTSLLAVLVTIASARASERENTISDVAALSLNVAPEAIQWAFDAAALPAVHAIDDETDITVFLRDDVPAEMQLAALRRAWTVTPAIRDFRSLQENHWDFESADAIPGFGDIGAELDIKHMVAQILGDYPRLASLPLGRSDGTNSFSFTNTARRLIFGTAYY